MDCAELVQVKERILADEGPGLYRAETNARFAKGMGWWTAEQDEDGVRVLMNLEGSGKRTIYLDKCTPETMFDDPKNITTLALTVRDYCGSIDETRRLIVEHTHWMCSITMSEDPSGCGCKFTWWPEGLHDAARTIQSSCTHQEVQLALIWCFVEAVLKESWFMKQPESVVNTDKEISHEQVA